MHYINIIEYIYLFKRKNNNIIKTSNILWVLYFVNMNIFYIKWF